MKEKESLDYARTVLTVKGFSNIIFLGKPYDFEAEKDSILYGIEVKGSNISFTTSWSQLKQIHDKHFLPKGHKALLLFIAEEGYCLFEMVDAEMFSTES